MTLVAALNVEVLNTTMVPSPDTDGVPPPPASGPPVVGSTEISSAGAAASDVPSLIQPTEAAANRTTRTIPGVRRQRDNVRLIARLRTPNAS